MSRSIYIVFIITEASEVRVVDSLEKQERPKQGFRISLIWRNSTAQENSEVDSACFLTATGVTAPIHSEAILGQCAWVQASALISDSLSLKEGCEEPS